MNHRIVLITGASNGIGRDLAITFNNYGFKVYATSRNIDSMNDLTEKGINVLQLDVTNRESIENAVSHIINNEGKIDILVNNAGLLYYGPSVELPLEDLRQIMEVNFFGLVNTTMIVAKHMIEKRNGIILNIGSISGVLTSPWTGGYCASKAAVHSWSNALRMELDPFNIKVITSVPGPISSGIIESSIPKLRELVERSVYKPIADFILARPTAIKSMQVPVNSFSDHVMQIIFSRRIPEMFRFGPGSIFTFFLSILPFRFTDWLLKKRAGLFKLKSIIQQQQQ